MKSAEYIWWIETIRQENFRRLLPLNIIQWVAFTIFLISLILFFFVKTEQNVTIILFKICVASFFIAGIGVIVKIATLQKKEQKIKAVKKEWLKSEHYNQIYPEELNYFYAKDIEI